MKIPILNIKFNVFFIRGKICIITNSLHKIIEDGLLRYGRGKIIAEVIVPRFGFKKSKDNELLMDKIIKIYKYKDMDYAKLAKKFSPFFLSHVLSAKGWSDPEITDYIDNLPSIK